jgi:phenylalanyl-tRNA synthetase alpha chain
MGPEEMRATLAAERARGLDLAASAGSLEDLEAARTSVMGRRSAFGELQRGLGSLHEDQRRALGKEVNDARQALTAAFDEAKDRLAREQAGALLLGTAST